MRALSALAFVISVFGLLLVLYNQLGIMPALQQLYSTTVVSSEHSIVRTHRLEDIQSFVSILSIIIGAFSVIFCTMLYLRKRTRMTLLGTIIGFLVTIIGIIHAF